MNTDLTGFVIAAYLVTLLGIGSYSLVLLLRVRRARQQVEDGFPATPPDESSRLHVVELVPDIEVQDVR